jgi:hypothetical protein
LLPLARVWEPVPGATLYVVTISDAKTGAAIGSMKTKGTLVATAGKALLVPGGAYLVEVAATGDLGSPKASRAFQVASVQVAREFTAAAALLERRAKPRDVAYLTASLAIRKGLLLEAEKVLARAVAQGPRELGPSHPAFEATVDLRAHATALSWSFSATSAASALRRGAGLAGFALLVLMGGTAAAGDPPAPPPPPAPPTSPAPSAPPLDTPEQVAAAVREAIAAGDSARLGALAAIGEPSAGGVLYALFVAALEETPTGALPPERIAPLLVYVGAAAPHPTARGLDVW